MSRIGLCIATIVVVASLFLGRLQPQGSIGSGTTRAEGRPNILLIVTDDQRWDTMDFMPRVKSRIFEQGVTFTNAFSTTPLCCPSRASIFTGMYAQHHGVHLNTDPLLKPNFVRYLDNSGYYTGLVGKKYLNSWPNSIPRSEFDYWAVGGGYELQTNINVDGADIVPTQYVTYAYRDYAERFLEQAAAQSDPFMLMFATNAPHIPAIPAPGDEALYPDLPAYRPPSFNEADITDKGEQLRNRNLLSATKMQEIDATRKRMLQSLNAVDIAVDDMLSLLDEQGILDNTLVLFLSDNGYMWGEHRLVEKTYPYEESVRIPFAIRYPPLIPAPVTEDRLVATIDIAPTIYELAGIPAPPDVDGRSLVPLLTGTQQWRDDLLLEGWHYPFNAVHTGRYVYIEDGAGGRELYDLQADPYQLESQAGNPDYSALLADMVARLDRYKPTRAFEPRVYDSASVLVNYGKWSLVADDLFSAESYHVSSSSGDTAYYTTPSATSMSVVTYRGPNQGKMHIKIDNVDVGTWDLYAPQPEPFYTIPFDNLPSGRHTIIVRPAGERNPASRGTRVRLDALIVDGTPVENDTGAIIYSSWRAARDSRAVSGSYRRSDRKNTTVTLISPEKALTIISARGPAFGIAEILVNNVVWQRVDLYSPTIQFNYPIRLENLPAGKNQVIRIRVTGEHNPSSTGNAIVFDAFAIDRSS